MKCARWSLVASSIALVLCLASGIRAEEKKSVTGKASCAGCSGLVEGCNLLLTDKDGGRWLLKGDSDSFKAAFKARGGGKTMTATLDGDAVTKKAKDDKEYKEVKVSEVKIAES